MKIKNKNSIIKEHKINLVTLKKVTHYIITIIYKVTINIIKLIKTLIINIIK